MFSRKVACSKRNKTKDQIILKGLFGILGFQKLFQNHLTFSQCSTWLSCSDQRGFLHLQKDFPQLFWLTLFWVSQCRFLLCYHMNLYHCKAYPQRILIMGPYLYEGSLRSCVIFLKILLTFSWVENWLAVLFCWQIQKKQSLKCL